jgi:hypothetical protein
MQMQRPGLYVQTRVRPAEPVPLRSDIAGFIGRAYRGPVGTAMRLESWREFESAYGGLTPESNLSYAVRGYFENGGQIAYVLRTGHEAPLTATPRKGEFSRARSLPAAPRPPIQVIAASPGCWANGLRVSFTFRPAIVDPASRRILRNAELTLRVQPPQEPDEIIGPIALDELLLREEPGDPEVDPLVRAVANRSQLITITATLRDVLALGVGPLPLPRVVWDVTISQGVDGTADTADYGDALTGICGSPDPALLAFPDVGQDMSRDDAAAFTRRAIAVCEQMKDRMVLVEVPADPATPEHPALGPQDAVAFAAACRQEPIPGGARAAAFYHPWLLVADPLGGIISPLRYVPPSGHVAGAISRSDRERGASYTPANTELVNAVDVARAFSETVEAQLNRAGVNLIRCFPGEGLKIWGGSTLARSGAPAYRNSGFVAHRRLINRLVRAIHRVAEPLVFDNNGPELWLTLFRGVNSVLFEAFQHGALKGNRPEEAYQIRCDATINTQEIIDSGRVYCEIQVAPAAPMEFILLTITFGGDGQLEVFES